MSTTDLESQDSMEADSSEYEEDEDGVDDYYANVYDDEGMSSDKEEDPESFEFEIIDPNEAEQMFDSMVAKVCQEIKVRIQPCLCFVIGGLVKLLALKFSLIENFYLGERISGKTFANTPRMEHREDLRKVGK